jgi:SAM-dependent methyltransferase
MSKLDPLAADPAVIATYAEALIEHGATPEALGWAKPEKVPMRYEALCGGFKPEVGILDYGCGAGGLAAWLDEVDFAGSYAGFDPCAEAIAAAKAKFPEQQNYLFRHIAGAWSIPNGAAWDHVVACGVFTRMGVRDEGAHRIHIRETLARLLSHTRIGLHVDFLDAAADVRDPANFYAAPWDVLALARTLSPRVSLDASYLPYEFCIHIYRDTTVVAPRNVYGSEV